MPDASAPLPSNAEMARVWIDQHAHASVAGQRGDDALFNVACALWHGFDMGPSAIDLLRHYNAVKCSPPWDEGRLQYKLKQASVAPQKHAAGGLYRWMLRKQGVRTVYRGEAGGGRRLERAAPTIQVEGRLDFRLDALQAEVRDVPGWVDAGWLRGASPLVVEGCTSAQFLEALYRPNERVLIFTKFMSQGQFIYWAGKFGVRLAMRRDVKGVRSELPAGGPDGVWFLCQPVTGEWKLNPRSLDDQGRPKWSRRSEEVVTSFRYLVLESDEAPGNEWLRFLAKLKLPIAAIYTSGGRSIHALVKVDAPNKAWWDRYKALIVPPFSRLGADPGALTAVRLTRLPGCRRGNKLQELLYLDPEVKDDGRSILERSGVL